MADVQNRIEQLISDNQVVLFMKGTPQFPQCGFSARAVAILNEIKTPFASVNVLEDAEIREAIKAFSQWPTIPQLYVNHEFLGGSDDMMEAFETGELQKLVGQK